MKQQYESARTELDNARIVFEQNILHASEPMQQVSGKTLHASLYFSNDNIDIDHTGAGRVP